MQTHIGEGFELTARPASAPGLIAAVWRSRSLIRMLARRDFYVRYRRPTFGVLWIVGVPLIHAAVLATVFSLIVKIETGTNYATFVLAGIVPWTFFSNGVSRATTSITDGSGLASKVYFPRAAFPLVAVLSNVYGFVPSLAILVVVALIFGVSIGPAVLLLIPAFVLMVLLTSTLGLVLGALQVYYRDVSFIIQAVMIAWFYASAVFFPIAFVPDGILQHLVVINPATGLVELFRGAIVGFGDRAFEAVLWSIGWTVGLGGVAVELHRRFDRVFVDLL